ncbi:hypothetical protein V6N12_050016 [Hibiscus sabdariffa]|uniref:Uncharacterized protein n=1 Tax=Hibiscus sabdariffa TaxID=183260 RepID=A0ABR2GB60_9ROSI
MSISISSWQADVAAYCSVHQLSFLSLALFALKLVQVFNLPSMAMEKAKGDPRQKRVPPKRGQIKGRIMSTIMESVLRVASNAGKRLQRKKKKVVASEMLLQKNQIKLA